MVIGVTFIAHLLFAFHLIPPLHSSPSFFNLPMLICSRNTQYASPIAKKIGATGGDVGGYFSLVSVCISYPILRTQEIKWLGR